MSEFRVTDRRHTPRETPETIVTEKLVTVQVLCNGIPENAPRLSCKDIPDEAFLTAVTAASNFWHDGNPFLPVPRLVVDAMLVGSGCAEGMKLGVAVAFHSHIPEKLMIAKARKLIWRGLMDGCCCGCRGDWQVTDKMEGERLRQLAINPNRPPLISGWRSGGREANQHAEWR